VTRSAAPHGNGTYLDEEFEADGTAVSRLTPPRVGSSELAAALTDVKGQAQFLLYLADQIEESLGQLAGEGDACQAAFLCKVLTMYSAQLENKHQGLGERIAEACQEVYVTVREYDPS